MAGPQELRLRQAVSGISRAQIETAGDDWSEGAMLLTAVADALAAAGPAMVESFGGETGQAAAEAFETVRARVAERARQMIDVSTALTVAGIGARTAELVRDSMGAEPSQPRPPSYSPGTPDADAVRAETTYRNRMASYDSAIAARETRAAQAVAAMDSTYDYAIAVMRQVHGEPDPALTSPTRDGGAGAPRAVGGSTVAGPAGAGGAGGTTAAGGTTGGTIPDGSTSGGSGGSGSGGSGPGGSGPGGSGPGGSGSGAPGTLGGGAGGHPGHSGTPPDGSGGPVTVGGGQSGGGAGSLPTTVGGVAGAVGGGLVAGTAGITGAIRGGPVLPVTGGAAGGSRRSLGGSSRSGSSGALGRGGATTAGGGSGTRSAGSRATGGRGATGKGGSVSRSGGLGAAGSRGQLAGQGAGRGDRKRDRARRTDIDYFDETHDWVDDEGAAPGVIE